MSLNIISCGIFQPELEKVLSEIQESINLPAEITFVAPGLHTDNTKLEQGITEALEPFNRQNRQEGHKKSFCSKDWVGIR